MIKEKILKLINFCKDDKDLTDIIKKDVQSIGEYVNAVYMMETSLAIIRARFDGQELRDRIENLDKNRRFCHERAIMGVKRLNRFAEMAHLEPIFIGDTSDRYQIADFCRDTVNEFFDGRDGVERQLDLSKKLDEEIEW